tara:strand:+ start:248 stop:1003 length:756 start_codon:yes stop_codon:yes gene_type:complete
MQTNSKAIRIQKYLADQGICSRRVAEGHIKEGMVSVNGKTAELGAKIEPGVDRVSFNGKPVHFRTPAKLTVCINKPKGFICSNDDPHNDRTVFDLLPKEFANQRLFCAGRLDKDSEGLVILTNDGDLANQLMHPSGLVVKRYRVSLKQSFPHGKLQLLVKGLTYESERLKVETAHFVGNRDKETESELDLSMHHGKKREIRRLFTALGYDVKTLKRYQIGEYAMKGLPKGAGIPLNDSDIKKLFKIAKDRK